MKSLFFIFTLAVSLTACSAAQDRDIANSKAAHKICAEKFGESTRATYYKLKEERGNLVVAISCDVKPYPAGNITVDRNAWNAAKN